MGGCWTCRLRRKKCPEELSVCSRCINLKVTCYGYGPRPDWMNGGPAEKEKLKEIQKVVKRTTDSQRRPRALQALSQARDREAAQYHSKSKTGESTHIKQLEDSSREPHSKARLQNFASTPAKQNHVPGTNAGVLLEGLEISRLELDDAANTLPWVRNFTSSVPLPLHHHDIKRLVK